MNNLNNPSPETIKKIGKGVGFTLLAGILFFTGVARIPANTVGVKVSAFSGVSDNTMPTGWHLKLPFFETVYKLPTSVETKTITEITTQTSDAQWLKTNVDIKYRIDQSKAMDVFKNYRTMENISENVITPAAQRAIESITVKYDIYEALGSKRNDMYTEIEKALAERLGHDNLTLVSVTITDTDAGDEIEKAIKDESVKQKQVDSAKQDQERAKIDTETKKIQAKADADARIIAAEGEKKANELKSASITENIIKMKEAEAREKHGWVEVQSSGQVITQR